MRFFLAISLMLATLTPMAWGEARYLWVVKDGENAGDIIDITPAKLGLDLRTSKPYMIKKADLTDSEVKVLLERDRDANGELIRERKRKIDTKTIASRQDLTYVELFSKVSIKP